MIKEKRLNALYFPIAMDVKIILRDASSVNLVRGGAPQVALRIFLSVTSVA